MQILAGVHMRAESAEHPVVLSATDMELSVRATLDAQVRAPGEIVLPGRLVTDLIGKSSNDEVTIEQRDGDTQVQVKTGHAEASLSTYTVQDFPRLPEFDQERAFGIEREGFLRTARGVQRAASRDESRPVLTGVKLELAPGRLTMAATDSYRMAVKHTTLAGGPPEEIEAIVPARALAELARIAGAPAATPRHGGRREPGAVPQRRRDAVGATHRRAVPELPPAASPTPSSTSCPCGGRTCAT